MSRFLLLLFLVLPFENFSQDIKSLLLEAQEQESAFKENEAFQKYAEILRIQPSNMFALCKCSELCSRIGNRQTERSKKTDYFKAARTYAEAALRVNPNNSEANFVMAFAMGRLSLMSSGKEKIVAARDIKYYADISIKADPGNYKPYHVLGKWNYEVSDLNSFERTLAKLFFGGLPKASLKNSIIYFEKSRTLNPSFVLNYLELARAYRRSDQKNKSIELLNKMLTLPNILIDDSRAKKLGRQLLSELQ
jgi:hypothetical protein